MPDRKTKIVATIGPASERPDILVKLIDEGMNVARLNFSHGGHQEQGARIENIRKISAKKGKAIGIICDLQGPKIRIGELPEDGILLEEGQEAVFDTSIKKYDGASIPLPSPVFAKGSKKGDKFYLYDGTISAEIIKTDGGCFTARILNGGMLYSNKGVNAPDLKISGTILEDKDRKDLNFAKKIKLDYIALSFIRTAEDVLHVKELLKGSGIRVIAKIERPEALENLDEIISVADAIMVARGDLGVETPIWALPIRQKDIIERSRVAGKPVIVATQMLESMTKNPLPTRAEVSDVANAVYDSADAVMLSGETANGKYPVETVRMMRKILEETERSQQVFGKEIKTELPPITYSLAKSAKYMAEELGAKFIFAGTASGYTARALSRFRPKVPVIALASEQRVANQLSLVWGVLPFVFKGVKKVTDLPGLATKALSKKNRISKGDRVIFISGLSLGETGHSSILNVLEV